MREGDFNSCNINRTTVTHMNIKYGDPFFPFRYKPSPWVSNKILVKYNSDSSM